MMPAVDEIALGARPLRLDQRVALLRQHLPHRADGAAGDLAAHLEVRLLERGPRHLTVDPTGLLRRRDDPLQVDLVQGGGLFRVHVLAGSQAGDGVLVLFAPHRAAQHHQIHVVAREEVIQCS